MFNQDMTMDMIEFKLINTVFKTKIITQVVEGQKTKVPVEVISKEFNSRKFLRKDGITSIEDYVCSSQKIAKQRAVIFDKYSNRYYSVNHSVDEIRHRLQIPKNKIGF